MTEIATAQERTQTDIHQVIDGSGFIAVANTVTQEPKSNYKKDYQPKFPDEEALNDALEILSVTEGVTTPESIEAVLEDNSRTSSGEDKKTVVTVGFCDEELLRSKVIRPHVQKFKNMFSIVKSFDARVTFRGGGQSKKPRSDEFETLENGDKVNSYYGSIVNGHDVNDREPDPTRMIAVAEQAVSVRELLDEEIGHHVPVSHEALLKVYEESFIVEQDGKRYLTSCDTPWIGMRTNDPDGMHVEMLSTIENPVAVKIGPGDDAEKIVKLAEKLNPDNIPGKLTFVLRFGMSNIHEAPDVLLSIKEHAPESIILCDPMHGNTVKHKNGMKTRELPKIISEVHTLAGICNSLGLRLHGLHLEANGLSGTKECVDNVGEAPKDAGRVDPELSNEQLTKLLDETKECFYDKEQMKSIRLRGGFVVIPK